MNYEVKTGAESVWLSVQTAIAAVIGWQLSAQTDMDTTAIVIVASAIGSAARPVLGYLIAWLPRRGSSTGTG